MAPPDARYGYLPLRDGRGYVFPLSGRAAARAVEIYPAQTLKARVARRLLALALRMGAGRYVLSPAEGVDGALLEHLREVLGRPELVFAISLGVPGPHGKPVLQALTPEGETVTFVKVGWNQQTRALVTQETDTLRMLRKANLSALIVPDVLYAGAWRGRVICAQSPAPGSAPPQTFGPLHRSAIRSLATLAATEYPVDTSPFWATLQARAGCISNRYYGALIENGMQYVARLFGRRPIPFHFAHGDFTPWNCTLGDGGLFLYDWEYAGANYPAGWDVIRFFVQTQHLVERRSPGAIRASFQPDGAAGRELSAHLQHLGTDTGLEGGLLVLYLLDQLAFYAAENPEEVRMLRALATLLSLCILEEGA